MSKSVPVKECDLVQTNVQVNINLVTYYILWFCVTENLMAQWLQSSYQYATAHTRSDQCDPCNAFLHHTDTLLCLKIKGHGLHDLSQEKRPEVNQAVRVITASLVAVIDWEAGARQNISRTNVRDRTVLAVERWMTDHCTQQTDTDWERDGAWRETPQLTGKLMLRTVDE